MKKLIMFFLLSSSTLLFSQTKDYNITEFGAKPDTISNNALFIQNAIDTASAKGGGRVIVPSGVFMTGCIKLKAGVNLFLETSAVLLGSDDRKDYGGYPAVPLVSADNADNVSITGLGTIDGNGHELIKDIFQKLREGTLDDPDWKIKRPIEFNRPRLVSFNNCTNVIVKGVTIKNGTGWIQLYDNCTDLTIDGIRVESTTYWNNDGIDVTNSKNVKITNCFVNAADDGICFKSEGEQPGMCENFYVADCTIRSSASAIKFGTASHGGFKNFTIKNINIYDTYRSAIALECVDGGIMDSIDIRNITAKNTGNALFIRLGKRNKEGGYSQISNIHIAQVTVEVPKDKPDASYPLDGPPVTTPHNTFPVSIVGLPGHPVKNVTLETIRIIYPGGADKKVAYIPLDSLANVPEKAEQYPEFSMFGELPCWGIYVRHAEGIKMDNVRLSYKEYDFRPACVFDDVDGLDLFGINVLTGKDIPVILLNNVRKYSLISIKLPVDYDKGIKIQ